MTPIIILDLTPIYTNERFPETLVDQTNLPNLNSLVILLYSLE